jgi:hypothetical protein
MFSIEEKKGQGRAASYGHGLGAAAAVFWSGAERDLNNLAWIFFFGYLENQCFAYFISAALIDANTLNVFKL